MFAPLITKTKTKPAELKRAPSVPQRPIQSTVDQVHVLQRTIGNQAMLRLLAQRASAARSNEPGASENAAALSGGIQAKLKVGAVNDPLEHEADRVAEHVMSMPAPGVFASAAPLQVSRKCAACEEEEKLQKKPAGPQATASDAPIVHEVLRSPGQPLDESSRAYFEPRFGRDFSRVRVHTGRQATESARKMSARAYTSGSHIVFGDGEYAPASDAGRQLLSHELTHVIQQGLGMGELIQRAPGGGATAPVKALESLEAVAQRIARLAVGPASAKVNLKGGPDKVVSVVRNVRTGKLVVGLNTGTPAKPTRVIHEAIKAQEARIKAGEVEVVHTSEEAMGGGHAEVNALDKAIAEEEKALGYAMTEEEITATFEMHNVWLSGKHQFSTAGRCEHCRRITRGVSVTESLFKAEGGVSGEINVPPSGKVTGGKTVSAPEPAVKPTSTVPEQVPETLPEVKVPGPSVGKSAVKLVVTEIALNVLLFAVTYYLNKWHAEKQVRKFKSDLEGLLPEINTRLKVFHNLLPFVEKAFPLVYCNITIVYTHDEAEPEDYNEGSMSIQDVAISHQNYQTPERLIKHYDPISGNDPSYSLTFSMPLFEEKTAEKGASSLVRDYRQFRKNLTDPGSRTRLSAVMALYNLAKQDSSLKTLVVRDLLGMLKDETGYVRLAAVVFLSRLKATIAIKYIREVIPITSDDKDKELIQRSLRELEHG
jgi:hypothetical protein